LLDDRAITHLGLAQSGRPHATRASGGLAGKVLISCDSNCCALLPGHVKQKAAMQMNKILAKPPLKLD